MDTLLSSLELKIKDFIEILYDCVYTMRLKVEIGDDDYTLKLPTSNQDRPITMTLQTTDEDKFFDFICEELSNRGLDQTKYLTVKYTEDEQNQR